MASFQHINSKYILPFFAVTIFVSAFLLFQVQPMISKLILPWFGGSPAVWTTAMLFFQCILSAGYFYAHALTRIPSRQWQGCIHVILLIFGILLAGGVLPDSSLKPTGDESPSLHVLVILGVSVGLPYFCLATTGPLVQYWFSHTTQSGSVYRLYALSNIGSFLALLSFPYLLEPNFDLKQMGLWWSWGFFLFILLCFPISLGWGQQVKNLEPSSKSKPDLDYIEVSVWMRLRWLSLPALASLVFITATDQVSHNVAPEPSLWITTLGLYLLTFILTFDHPRWYRPVWTAFLALIAILITSGRDEIPGWFNFEWHYGVTEMRLMHYALLFLVCMMCHGELYRQRPRNTRYLTEFYLWMSVGGACGSLFVTLFATHFFNDYHEWYIAVILVITLAFFILKREWEDLKSSNNEKVKAQINLYFLTIKSTTMILFLCFVSLYTFISDPLDWRIGIQTEFESINLSKSRNFYGTLAVTERRYQGNPEQNHRVFYSGQVTHGLQYLSADRRYQPTTYYGLQSGVGETFEYLHRVEKPLHVGLIGLGAGTLANYARAQDRFDFFEINPEVIQISQKWFDNLSTIKTKEVQIIVGDARLQIARLPATTKYDVIVLDAFTGGSVPIHLLTKEAFQIYENHLKSDGFIIINITNAYLNLYPVVRAQAEALGMNYRSKFQDIDKDQLVLRNQYFIMTNDMLYLKDFPSVSRELRNEKGLITGVENRDRQGLRLWTDQFSSIYQIQW